MIDARQIVPVAVFKWQVQVTLVFVPFSG
jgi:hypothetical protein